MKIPGLPDGVEVVRIGICGPDEFDVVNDPTNTEPPRITKGPRAGSSSQIIIRPAKGYEFRQQRAFDIRKYEFNDTPFYSVVKLLDAPLKIERSVTFQVDNDQDEKAVRAALDQLKGVPGYVEMA